MTRALRSGSKPNKEVKVSKEEFVKKMTNLCLVVLVIGYTVGWLVGRFL